MKARVKTTGEVIEIIRNSAFDMDVFYDSNGQKYNREELSFYVKEKSLSTDEPDYWEKLKHQYVGMAMQGILANCNHQLWEREANSKGIAKNAYEIANALINELKEKENESKRLD